MDVIAKRTKSFAITPIDTEKADFAGQPFVCVVNQLFTGLRTKRKVYSCGTTRCS